MQKINRFRLVGFFFGCMSVAMLGGCASTHQTAHSISNEQTLKNVHQAPQHEYTYVDLDGVMHDTETFTIPVVRVGRYTLVTQDPQVTSMRQLPISIDMTDVSMSQQGISEQGYVRLETAISAAIARSGYSLCSTPAVDRLIQREVPAAHYQLGPMTLTNVLQVLIGSEWMIHFNDQVGTVCFTAKDQIPSDASLSVTNAGGER